MSFVFFFSFPVTISIQPKDEYVITGLHTFICSRDRRKEIVTGACGYVCNQEQRNDGLARIISARTTSLRFAKGHCKGH